MAKAWEVIARCPTHQKNVYIRVEAPTGEKAIEKVLGMTIDCPWAPTHTFVVGFRKGREEILGVTALPWMPPTIVSVAPGLTPITPVPATPLETFYYVDSIVAERQLSKLEWWRR